MPATDAPNCSPALMLTPLAWPIMWCDFTAPSLCIISTYREPVLPAAAPTAMSGTPSPSISPARATESPNLALSGSVWF